MSAERKPARIGRPPSDNPANRRLSVRVTPERHAAYMDAAQAAGLSLTDWIEALCDRAAKRAAR